MADTLIHTIRTKGELTISFLLLSTCPFKFVSLRKLQ